MNIHLADEVVFAAHQALGGQSTLVSRRSIEQQIMENPGLYPLLNPVHQKSRRNIISRVMNSRYAQWGKNKGECPNSWVWQIRENQEDSL